MIVNHVGNIAAMQKALQTLTEFLAREGVPAEKIFDSKLIACELLSNVLRHTDSSTKLHGEIKDGHIELKIFSKELFEAPKQIVCSEVFCENGRGLFLVQELCEGKMTFETDGIRVRIRIKN